MLGPVPPTLRKWSVEVLSSSTHLPENQVCTFLADRTYRALPVPQTRSRVCGVLMYCFFQLVPSKCTMVPAEPTTYRSVGELPQMSRSTGAGLALGWVLVLVQDQMAPGRCRTRWLPLTV